MTRRSSTWVFHRGAMGDSLLLWPRLRAWRKGGEHVVLVTDGAKGRLAAREVGVEWLDVESARFNVLWREGATPALGAPEAVLLPPGTYAAWQARAGREGAQHKVPRITTEVPNGLELH